MSNPNYGKCCFASSTNSFSGNFFFDAKQKRSKYFSLRAPATDSNPKCLNVPINVFWVNPDLCDMYKFPAAIEGRNPYNMSIGAMGPAGEVYAGSVSLSSLRLTCRRTADQGMST